MDSFPTCKNGKDLIVNPPRSVKDPLNLFLRLGCDEVVIAQNDVFYDGRRATSGSNGLQMCLLATRIFIRYNEFVARGGLYARWIVTMFKRKRTHR